VNSASRRWENGKGKIQGKRKGPVAEKPSESGNNTHFQSHSCPGPDFEAEKGKNGIFSRNIPPGNGIFAIFNSFSSELRAQRQHFGGLRSFFLHEEKNLSVIQKNKKL
jgi:hypothetical protein